MNAGSQAGVRFSDNLMLPKPDWSGDAPPGADELLVRARQSLDVSTRARGVLKLRILWTCGGAAPRFISGRKMVP